jgi:Holliday junction DNA helicase RuvB
MAIERIVSGTPLSEEEERLNRTLRPTRLSEYIGQRDVVAKLEISIKAAKERGEPMEHVLFYGPPGLGKTTLAHIIATRWGEGLSLLPVPPLFVLVI